MDAWTLDAYQVRWIEQCAKRLMAIDESITHARAVELAFDLLRVWPMLPPHDAAEAYLAPIVG